MQQLDFIVMVIFALLIFSIGLAFTRMGSKNGQAFFEAGGETPWWINGLSLFVSYFSAGTFVVWGSIAYKHGLVSNAIQLTMAISGFFVALFIAKKWKRTRVKTAAEYIGKRFSIQTQQFYTYLVLLLSLFTTASVLYPVGKMVHVATPYSLNTCIIIIGMIIVLYTAAGGLWAVLVTDVVQFVILAASVLIVIPIAFSEIGGPSNFIEKKPTDFFNFFNSEYTLGFMLAFILYQTVYLGGNWSYVQRYTSVKDEKKSQKVAYLFTILYFISPILWMLPPMIYRIINPNLQGLEPEGAYMMLCQKVLPAGLIGLVLAGMISATSSKANTTINLAATVFSMDIYRNLFRKNATEKELIFIARLFTLVFGGLTVLIAIYIPYIGGIVDFVLSIASIAGSALFAPIIWSLYSKRQTSFSVVTATIFALLVNLFLKIALPILFEFKLSRSYETICGVLIPIFILTLFEWYYIKNKMTAPNGLVFDTTKEAINDNEPKHANKNDLHIEAESQNIFGIKVISYSMMAVGLGIIILGIAATQFTFIVVGVGFIILLCALLIFRVAKRKDQLLAKLLVCVAIIFGAKDINAQSSIKSIDTISLNGVWNFRTDIYKQGEDEKWYLPNTKLNKWETLIVPSSWDTYNEYAYYTGDAWYRYSFKVDKNLSQKQIKLFFESVYNYADIWLNGVKIGSNRLGYLSFQFNVNQYLQFGKENIVVLKVNNMAKLGATWNWGGIRKPVWLEITDKVRINHLSINAIPNLVSGTASISINTEIENNSNIAASVYYDANIYFKGKLVFQLGKQLVEKISANDTVVVNTKMQLKKEQVYLWHFENPSLYEVQVNLYKDQNIMHHYKDRFGIRKIEVDGYKLKLNGEEIRTVGFNIVPEDRVYGNAMPIERFKKMVDLMKQSGANMARLSHFALPKLFLDYLDEKGIMTFEEVSLWGKDTLVNPNHLLPKIWLAKLIRQQYNHPSIIGWSVGNEIGSYKNNPLVFEYIKSAITLAKELDPNRLVSYASNTAPSQLNDPASLCDIILLNKYDGWGKSADLVHKNFPTKLIFFSEIGPDLNDENLDNSTISINQILETIRGKEYVAGASLWTFNDYRSNYWSPRPTWVTPPSENRTWGIVNSVLQPKKSYYEVKKAFQPFVVQSFFTSLNDQLLSGEIQLETRNRMSFPAYTLNGYSLQLEAKNQNDETVYTKLISIPVLNPGEKSGRLQFKQPIDLGIHYITFTIVDNLGYSRYDTTVFLKKPNIPKIIEVFNDLKTIRVIFEKPNNLNKYFIRYGISALNKVTDTAILNSYIDIKELNSDSTYSFQLVSMNNQGLSETDINKIKLTSKELPPIIWEVIPIKKGFFISYNTDQLDYKYEVKYGLSPNQYNKQILLGNKGGLMIPNLTSGVKYFLRMRRVLQSGFASEWTNELEVTTK